MIGLGTVVGTAVGGVVAVGGTAIGVLVPCFVVAGGTAVAVGSVVVVVESGVGETGVSGPIAQPFKTKRKVKKKKNHRKLMFNTPNSS